MSRQRVELKSLFNELSGGPMGWVEGYLSTLQGPRVNIMPNGEDTIENILTEPVADEDGVPDRVLFSFNVHFPQPRGTTRQGRIPNVHIGSFQLPWKSSEEIFRNAMHGYRPHEFHEELKNYISLHSNMTWFMTPLFMLTQNIFIVKVTVIGIPTILHQQHRREPMGIGINRDMPAEGFRTDDDE